MPFSKEETLVQVKEILEAYLSKGREQIEQYKETHHLNDYDITNGDQDTADYQGQRMPIREIQRLLALEKDVYIYELIECFWNYFELRLNALETPAANGIDRVLFEVCYQRIIPVIGLSDEDLRDKIVEKQLCDIGVILSSHNGNPTSVIQEFSEDYDYWLSTVTNEQLKAKYVGLKEAGFPHDKLAKSKHELWGSFKYSVNDNLEKIKFPLAGSGDERRRSALNSLMNGYLHLHDFVHGDYVTSLSAIRNQSEMKHIFSTYTFITTPAMQILMTTSEEFLDNNSENFNDLFQQSHAIMPVLAQYYSHTMSQPSRII